MHPIISCEEYRIITSSAQTAYIALVSKAWPERAGSAIKYKKKILKNNVLNALLILFNGPQHGTLAEKELITNVARIYGEQNQYKKASSIKQKRKKLI